MIKLPSIIRIAGFEWRIRQDASGKGDLRGCTDHELREISIDTTAATPSVRSTLLHEMIHAIDQEFFPSGPPLAEKRVLALEKGLFATFNDNPGLARKIWGKNA